MEQQKKNDHGGHDVHCNRNNKIVDDKNNPEGVNNIVNNKHNPEGVGNNGNNEKHDQNAHAQKYNNDYNNQKQNREQPQPNDYDEENQNGDITSHRLDLGKSLAFCH